MHIYLNPPNIFWAIEDTEISLTRGNPFCELTEEDIEALDADQLNTLNLSLQVQTITQINPDFIPELKGKTTTDFILSRRAAEIQRKYVSRMIMAKDRASLYELLAAEKERSRPRPSVVQLLGNALEVIEGKEGGGFYDKIEELDDDLGGQAALPMELENNTAEVSGVVKPERRKSKGPRQPRVLERSV